ncbi:tyrosine-type recombinase/integrase [Myxococcota bacterium]|nr:tyrosine-type recombinase/integrase [Myxococcota bacterium]
MSPPKRPSPFRLRGLSYSVVRGPNADGEWYWRARDNEGRTVWTGWSKRVALLQRAPGAVSEPPSLRTVAELVQRWLEAREGDPQLKPETLVSYATRAKGVLALVGEEPLTELGPAFMERLRDRLVAAGLTQRGVHARQRLVRAAARWAAAEERLTHRPLPVVRLRSAERVNSDYTPTEDEALAALREMRGETALAATVLAITGARVSEVVHLTRGDLDLYGGWLRLRGKTGPRRFPLVAELRTLLVDRGRGGAKEPEPEHPDAPLFRWPMRAPEDAIRDQLALACRRAGVPRFTPHGLRRMVVNRILRAGADITAAAELMGHSPSVMLSYYRRVSSDDRAAGVAQAGLGQPLAVAGAPMSSGHRSRHSRR